MFNLSQQAVYKDIIKNAKKHHRPGCPVFPGAKHGRRCSSPVPGIRGYRSQAYSDFVITAIPYPGSVSSAPESSTGSSPVVSIAARLRYPSAAGSASRETAAGSSLVLTAISTLSLVNTQTFLSVRLSITFVRPLATEGKLFRILTAFRQ